MGAYSNFRSYLSTKNKGRLTRFLIQSGVKPTVNNRSSSPFKKGIVVFSTDFEMAWAFRYSKKQAAHAVQKGLEERLNVPVLTDLFDTHKIPVTWATVGHLFLKECSKSNNGFAHSELLRPSYFENRNWQFTKGDWYDHDPCTDYMVDPAWYAADLIDLVISTKTKHEIACHSFSHTDFTDKNCPQELAASELDACIMLASEKKILLRSMVFPGGTIGNHKTLKEKGFICYRKPMKHHIDLPYIDDFGLVAIPSSLGLDKDPYGWSKEFHLSMIRKFLSKAIKYKQICHFWFHPSMNHWYLQNVLPEIIQMTADLRNSGKLEILTMQQLAERFLAIEKPDYD